MRRFERGSSIARENGFSRALFKINARRADLARLQGRGKEAIELYNEVLANAGPDTSEMAEAHRWMAVLLKERKEYKAALNHHEKFHQLSMSLQENLLDNRLNELRVTHHLEKVEKEVEVERMERREKEIELGELTMELTEKGELIGVVRKEVERVLSDLREEERPALIKGLRRILRHVNAQQRGKETRDLTLRSVEEGYYKRLRERHPELTPGQQRLCGLLRAGMQSDEIIALLHLTTHGLKKQRYRLRKALELEKGERLEKYLEGM